MKKTLLVILALCMTLTLFGCGNKEKAPDGMKDVAPEKEKYNFYVPQNWRTNSGDVIGAYYSMSDRSNVSVMAYGGEATTSEEYWKSFKLSAESVFENFEIISENEAKVIDKLNALSYVYKMKLEAKEYKCMQTVVAYSNILYVITYTAPAENYESHLEDVEKMLSNFNFK